MKTLRIAEAFTGFPDGTESSARSFVAGEIVDLDDSFADLIIAKGHAVERPEPAAKPSKKEDRT